MSSVSAWIHRSFCICRSDCAVLGKIYCPTPTWLVLQQKRRFYWNKFMNATHRNTSAENPNNKTLNRPHCLIDTWSLRIAVQKLNSFTPTMLPKWEQTGTCGEPPQLERSWLRGGLNSTAVMHQSGGGVLFSGRDFCTDVRDVRGRWEQHAPKHIQVWWFVLLHAT